MDPNEALKRAREASTELKRWQASTGQGATSQQPFGDLGELVEHFDALDAWLVRGGFLPADWERKPLNETERQNRTTHTTKTHTLANTGLCAICKAKPGEQCKNEHGSPMGYFVHAYGGRWSNPYERGQAQLGLVAVLFWVAFVLVLWSVGR